MKRLDVRARAIMTYAFVKARYGNGYVTLDEIYHKTNGTKEDVIHCMGGCIMREIFERRIAAAGIVYRLTAKFRYVEFDEVNEYVNKKLNK